MPPVNLQKLLDVAVNLQAVFWQAVAAPPDLQMPELAFVKSVGATGLTVDLSLFGLDVSPKELGPQGREITELVIDMWKKGYTPYTQTIRMHEDHVKELDAKMPGWESIIQGWIPGAIKQKATLARNVLINGKTLDCWDGKKFFSTTHKSFKQGMAAQSNLLGYKFGEYALWAAVEAYEELKDPFSDQFVYNEARVIAYASNIQREVVKNVLSAVIAASDNPAQFLKLKPVKWRGLADDSFMILDDNDPAAMPIIEVYDDALGPNGVEWDESDERWFHHREYEIGTIMKRGLHPGAWHKALYSDGTAYHDDDAPAE